MGIEAANRLLAVEELESGVTFDAFKGWAKSKQREYLNEHPNSTFFDRLGITNRKDREVKDAEKQHKKLVKQSEKELKYDPTLYDEVNEKIRKSERKVKEVKTKNFRLGYKDRKKVLKAIRLKQKELLKEISRTKRRLLTTVSKKKRELLKGYIEKLKGKILLLDDRYQQILEME